MKQSIALLLFSIFTLNLSAQNENFEGLLKLKKIDFAFGFDSDKVKDFDYNLILDQYGNDPNFPIDQVNFANQELSSKNSNTPQIRFGMTLEIPKLKRLEIRNSINWAPNRIDAINFNVDDLEEYIDQFGGVEGYEFTSMTLGQQQSEIGLEASINYSFVENSIIKLYGGLGSNAGITYDENLYIIGSKIEDISQVVLKNEDQFVSSIPQSGVYIYSTEGSEINSQFNHRFFAQFGISGVILKKVEVGFDIRKGIGYRVTDNIPNQSLTYTSGNISLKYII